MGLRYSFRIIGTIASAPQLVEALAAHLVPDDAGRLLAALREDPRRLMELARRDSDCDDPLCLSFLFEPNNRVAEYPADELRPEPVTGALAFGCVWTYYLLGDRFVSLHCRAATSLMSVLFAKSPEVWGMFARIGQQAGALLVAFDDEEGDLVGVWPWRGRLGLCILEEQDEEVDGELRWRVDAYCEAVLGAVGASPLGQGPDV